MKRIFVTGIGTGIGKTVVAAILAEALRADYWKPVQAGDTDGTDTEKVKQLVSNSASRFYTEAFRLKAPLSPHDSAQREGIEIDLTGIRIPSTQNTLIIEGAGGLMVPLNKTCLIVDLIRQLDAGVVLVCKNYLGSINHTLMSCEILKTRNIPVLGIVFNGDSYPQGEEVILNRTGYKKILHLKPESAINKKTIETYAKILMGNGSLNPTDPHNTSSSYVNLAEEDRKTVWHPYTQMKSAEPAIPIVSGKNAWLYDHNGNGYIDAISSWWVNLHGHAHPYIAQKLYEQANRLEHVIFAGFTHPPAVHLAGQLLQVLPAGQEKIFYSDNGSTAVEVALKMALQYWYNTGTPRNKVIAFKDAYHGDTFGSMSVSERGAFTQAFHPLLFDVVFVDTPVSGKETETLKQFQQAIENNKPAAFIYEPLILGTAGMIMYEPEVLDRLLSVCKENNIITIADEVMTGFGRTGKWFASDYCQNKPDMVCLSKGLTGGTMAMGVTSCNAKIYDAFLSDDKLKTFFHGHSFTANPLSCTAALASIELLLRDDTKESIQRIITFHERFKAEIKNHPLVRDLRHRGTILALEIETGHKTGYFSNLRDRAYDFFMERGILLRPLGNVIYLLPPYCIEPQQLTEIYTAIKTFLSLLQKDE